MCWLTPLAVPDDQRCVFEQALMATSLCPEPVGAYDALAGGAHRQFRLTPARGAILQFVRKLVSPFHRSQALLISLALVVLPCATTPGIVISQNPPANGDQQGTVATQMRNVTFRFSDTVAVEIKSLDGVLVPLDENEFPNFDDKDSFKLRVSRAEIAMDSRDLANVLNSYVFRRPHSPLTQLSISVEKGHLKVKGKLHDKGDIPFETEGVLIPAADGKIRLHSERIKAMHLPVKGLMDLFGIDLSRLIQEGKVPGVGAQEDDLILDLEQILPPPHMEGKVVSVRMEGEKIIQIFGSSDTKPVKNIRAGNYMAFKNNRIRLGKLVMNDVDLILIDMDPNDPLDFFLDHYKEQLSAGYSKLTPDSGLRVYSKTITSFIPQKRLSATTKRNEVEARNRSARGAADRRYTHRSGIWFLRACAW
jgi:hypothetical protein